MDSFIESDHFTKLWHSIIDSTIWDADDQTRIVWITMLAKVNEHGNVLAAIPGLAHAARVPVPDCERALTFLKQPDPYSRSTEHGGRRIEDIPGGWHILNHHRYCEKQGRSSAAERMRRYRERQRNGDVTQRNGDVTQRNGDVTLRNALPDVDVDLSNKDPHTTKNKQRDPLLPHCAPQGRAHRARKGTENLYSGDFMAFMKVYPRKENMKRAYTYWERHRKAGTLPPLEDALQSVEDHKRTADWQRGAIPHPGTYINDARWHDKLSFTEPTTLGKGAAIRQHNEEVLKKMFHQEEEK